MKRSNLKVKDAVKKNDKKDNYIVTDCPGGTTEYDLEQFNSAWLDPELDVVIKVRTKDETPASLVSVKKL